jgi:hypothetical protein
MNGPEGIHQVLRDAGIGPDRVLVRPWCGGILVTLRDDDDAEPAAKALREAGMAPLVAGPRSILVRVDEPA